MSSSIRPTTKTKELKRKPFIGLNQVERSNSSCHELCVLVLFCCFHWTFYRTSDNQKWLQLEVPCALYRTWDNSSENAESGRRPVPFQRLCRYKSKKYIVSEKKWRYTVLNNLVCMLMGYRAPHIGFYWNHQGVKILILFWTMSPRRFQPKPALLFAHCTLSR